MMHTAACHIRMPAYRHNPTTAMPISSAAEMLTVKAHHLLSPLIRSPGRACYPAPKRRRVLRRSHRTRNRHFSHTPASAPHSHTGRPLRHPVNSCPTLITSCQRPLAFRKVRGDENAVPPGYHRFRETPRFLPGSPASFQWLRGCPALFNCHAWPYRAGVGPHHIKSGAGRGFIFHECPVT
jgi:hypothetical protein